jgi:hypothetical protein
MWGKEGKGETESMIVLLGLGESRRVNFLLSLDSV